MNREKNPNSPTPNTKSRKLKAIENDETFNFPDEIIAEILCRLPVKSVGRFRCVSKSWLSLTSTKRFIKTHLKVSTEDANANGYGVLLTKIDRIYCVKGLPKIKPDFGLKQCSVRSLYHEETLADVFNIYYPMKRPHRTVTVVGYCNGLICIAIDDTIFFLWNPATKESTKLPALRMKVEPGACSTIYGFGFDEPNDDYKVVRIVCLLRGRGRFKSIVYIYSLKTDSWKRVEDYKGNDVRTYPGMFANGKLHWLTDIDSRDLESGLDCGVFYLDLTSELYGTLDQPNYLLLGGCICVLCVYEETRVDLWV